MAGRALFSSHGGSPLSFLLSPSYPRTRRNITSVSFPRLPYSPLPPLSIVCCTNQAPSGDEKAVKAVPFVLTTPLAPPHMRSATTIARFQKSYSSEEKPAGLGKPLPRAVHITLSPLEFIFLLIILGLLLPKFASAYVGTAAQYMAPYIPTACFGNDESQFPPDLQFAMVDERTWDNGVVCGRQFLVNCISDGCISDQAIQVQVVDNAETSVTPPSVRGTNFVLSQMAFSIIANATALQINIEYTWI